MAWHHGEVERNGVGDEVAFCEFGFVVTVWKQWIFGVEFSRADFEFEEESVGVLEFASHFIEDGHGEGFVVREVEFFDFEALNFDFIVERNLNFCGIFWKCVYENSVERIDRWCRFVIGDEVESRGGGIDEPEILSISFGLHEAVGVVYVEEGIFWDDEEGRIVGVIGGDGAEHFGARNGFGDVEGVGGKSRDFAPAILADVACVAIAVGEAELCAVSGEEVNGFGLVGELEIALNEGFFGEIVGNGGDIGVVDIGGG